MGELKRLLISSCLVALVAGAAVKGPFEESFKAGPKPVYSRALGPPGSGMGSISVPYMPKSPFIPKFVDPKMMIAKKTDMLTNLFGGLGPAMYPDMTPVAPYGFGSSGQTGPITTDGTEEVPEKSLTPPWLQASSTDEEASMYKRGIFGPFSPKFGPMAPKFGPMSFGPYASGPSADAPADYSMMDGGFSRKRRSIVESPVPNLQSVLGDIEPDTSNLGPPPAYPGLTPIPEEPEMVEFQASATVPKEYLPGMFGPGGPGGPVGPMVDPSMFISKKYTFLDTLFKNIATSTPPPATTDVPVPKSTIVPPTFWFPTSMIPSPDAYNDKVSDFLDKLFDSLNLTKTTAIEDVPSSKRSVELDTASPEGRIARSIQDLSSISAAKDTIVDTILSELTDVKNDMMSTMDDLIAYQKTAAAAAAPAIPKKPFKPFAPGMWPKPSVDMTLPFKQRMTVLGQVFDMLTELQKNITVAVQGAIEASATPTNPPVATPVDIYSAIKYPINLTLADAIKERLASSSAGPFGMSESSAFKMGPKTVRMVPQTPTSFWVSYPGYPEKRQIIEEDSVPNDDDNEDNHRQDKRAVKMQMHQGYQNMPPGSVESVQAGGGSTPGHQGGGIKLLGSDAYGMGNKWFDWTQFVRKENEGQRHNHHHH